MPALAPPECAGLLALGALVVLPGLLVVRAPWTAVPALSVAFWTLTWWWLPLEGRSRLLTVALAGFALLATLRLVPKHEVPPPPGYAGPPPAPPVTGPTTGVAPSLRSVPSLLVVLLGILLLAPFGLWAHAPGREMAFHTTAARLAVWRNALPRTHEPLLPLGIFGAHDPALPTLAADVSLLSGLDPARSVVAVTLLAVALLALGLYALLATRLRPAAAALGAVVGLAAVQWPGSLTVWGEGGALLALALGLTSAALLTGHRSRPSAAAAGFLWAAAALSEPWLALAIAAATALAMRRTARLRPDGGPASATPDAAGGTRRGRLALACAVAVVLAGPALLRLARALSTREAAAALRSVRAGELRDFAVACALVSLIALLAGQLLPRRHRGASPGVKAAAAALAVCGAVFLVLRVHAWFAAGQIPLTGRSALARIARRSSPLDPVCAPPGLADWVPALAGRPVGEPRPRGSPEPSRGSITAARTGPAAGGLLPWVPPALREEDAARPRARCSNVLDGPPVRP